MKQEKLEKLLADYETELARQDARNSTGSIGKYAEVLIRNDIMKNGIKNAEDVRCRSAARADTRMGNSTIVEIKTGSGAVGYGYNLTVDQFVNNPDLIAAGAKLIVWVPFPKALQLTRTSYNRRAAWVFTRQQFIDTLTAIGKNGLRSSLKVSKGGAQVNIQTITPRMEDRLWDILDTLPTMADLVSSKT